MNCSTADYPLLELEEKNYEFSGHPLKITMFKGASLGVSAYVWGPGIVLCRYFEAEKIDFTGKKVLELGSGTGIVGILAVLLGGDVTMTDRPYVLKQIEYNILANIPLDCRHRSKIRALAWGSDQDSFATDFDIILGSDIVYSPSQFPNLIQTLLHFCTEKTIIYLCSDVKYREGSAEFHNELVPAQFHSQLIHTNIRHNARTISEQADDKRSSTASNFTREVVYPDLFWQCDDVGSPELWTMKEDTRIIFPAHGPNSSICHWPMFHGLTVDTEPVLPVCILGHQNPGWELNVELSARRKTHYVLAARNSYPKEYIEVKRGEISDLNTFICQS
ncbi:EEF1A lysine methyltransferase 3-like [Stegostoma tigrinum]|uniref:EEF1A lysine methyltransferase 3-like n=1 Tax=Stegostoma tigrinum TaxID=3053191 RepID=UPI002870627F|nr:EEF1A lysine methyltransferase 3-like [Stegostoma tigrinum]